MKKLVLAAVAATALAGSAFTLTAIAAPDPEDGPGPHRMMGGGFLLDAKLAGMKAVLKLTPDQEKLWPAFETAVRDGMKMRMQAMRAMREAMHDDEPPSPVAMMTMMSERMARGSEQLKKLAEATKPLYDSLDESQKDRFGPLLHMLRGGLHGMMGGMGMMRGMGGMGGPGGGHGRMMESEPE